MSDTPKTDELAKREFVADGVWIRHARELERENAALRKAKEMVELERCEMMRSMSLAQNQSEQLRADKKRLDWLHCTADGIKWQTNNTNLITREAIDLARKEAQP